MLIFGSLQLISFTVAGLWLWQGIDSYAIHFCS